MKFEDDLRLFTKLHRGVLGVSGSTPEHINIELKTYAKHILKEGSNEDGQELMGCLESKVVIKQKTVRLIH